MATELSFNLRTDKGYDISVMSDIIQKRTKELGETSKQSCVAMSINILKSLRADTRKASEKEKANLKITDVSTQYYPSFKRVGKRAERVLRSGKDGNTISKKVIWKCGKYYKGQIVHTYKVIDTVSDEKKFEYLVVCEDIKKATAYAQERHRNRIKRFKGLAKLSLGLAMHKLHEAQGQMEDVTQQAKQVGLQNTNAYITEKGYNSGSIAIHIEDNLKYATDALKNGESDVEITVQKALNQMIGYINHKLHQKGIYDDLKVPFPDIKGK